MEYEKEITVPANRPESLPVEETLKLDKGIVEDAYIFFPLGCVHKVLMRVFHGEFQIAPMNRSGWLRGEGARVPVAHNYDMTQAPYYWKIIACSPTTTKEHKPLIHVGLNPVYIVRPENVIVGHLKQIRTLLARMFGEE
jgi:hypothetical protein